MMEDMISGPRGAPSRAQDKAGHEAGRWVIPWFVGRFPFFPAGGPLLVFDGGHEKYVDVASELGW